ncbi:MAG TPA: antibiotic biosynthesis monooxygenase [Actinomycetota bacterium]|nr:antibiotic biosynthesis monooxygenase [Actinomycetota bacterium]
MPILSYLRFALASEADREAFEADLEAMRRLAATQPGFRWAEVARSLADPRVYVVVSLWDEVEQVRAWEHHPEHEEVIRRWEDRYEKPFVHQRYVPWLRPSA